MRRLWTRPLTAETTALTASSGVFSSKAAKSPSETGSASAIS
jgi:hypothetical protein